MKKKLLLFIMLAISLLLVSCKQTPSNIFEFYFDESYTEFLTLGTSADYPPYEWIEKVDGSDQVMGIDIEIAKEIAKAAKKNLRVIHKGFDFLLTDLESGKVDFVIAGMNPTPDREAIVDFSKIYYEASHTVLVHKDNSSKYQTIDDLNVAVKIGAQLGSVQADLVDENFSKANKVLLQDLSDLVMQLSDKKLDAVVLERPVAESYLKRFTSLVLKDFEIGNLEDGSAVAVRKNNQELLNLVNSVIDDLVLTGKMDEIIFKANTHDLSNSKGGFSFLLDKDYILTFAKGLVMTLVLALLSVVLGSILALGVTSLRFSSNKFINAISKGYVEIIRGTPLLVQVLLIYSFVRIPTTSFIGIDLSTFIPGMLALLINSSAYVSEIIRGGINSVDNGQKEAALSLGMNNKQVMNKIILPQAFKNIIPSLGNEFVTMIKETSIFMYLGVAELMYSAQLVKAGTYAIKEVYITVAVLYLILTLSTSKLMTVIEKRLAKNDKK